MACRPSPAQESQESRAPFPTISRRSPQKLLYLPKNPKKTGGAGWGGEGCVYQSLTEGGHPPGLLGFSGRLGFLGFLGGVLRPGVGRKLVWKAKKPAPREARPPALAATLALQDLIPPPLERVPHLERFVARDHDALAGGGAGGKEPPQPVGLCSGPGLVLTGSWACA